MLLNKEVEATAAIDLSHLQSTPAASGFISDVKDKVKEMRRLELAMISAEAAFKMAKETYEQYKATVVIASFVSAGIEQIQDDNGNFVKLESKYYCNPNKNDSDRLVISNWLKANGGEHLLKHEGKVSADQYDRLKDAGIPFADAIDINTNSLKAHLLDILGYKKGCMQKIALTDIPECVHFTIMQEVVSN